MTDAWSDIYTLPAEQKPAKAEKPKVPWAMKDWKQFTDEDRQGLAAHLKTMKKDEAQEYVKYLYTWCGAPHPSQWKILERL